MFSVGGWMQAQQNNKNHAPTFWLRTVADKIEATKNHALTTQHTSFVPSNKIYNK